MEENMKKRILSIVMVFLMIVSLLPSDLFGNAWAAEGAGISEMDALSALGIDTNEAPEGFDADDTSNPYGKNTMTVNPVSELYVLGLAQDTNNLDLCIPTSTAFESEVINNQLEGTIYGHRNNSSDDAAGIMESGDSKILATGTSTTSGDYDYLEGDSGAGNKSYLQEDNYQVDTALSIPGGQDMGFAASKVANGNFDGNSDCQSSQMAMLYAGDLDEHGGLYMRFGDTLTGALGDEKELISTSGSIGNPSGSIEEVNEDFASDSYLMQNYMQLTTGDYDGDGIDEVAVFVPELGNSRILVYKQKIETDQVADAYLSSGQWDIAWTYSLKESGYVSNMVSLVSGDFNEDGICDLGASWGYYYGPDKNNGSKAVVMFGSKGDMLQDAQEFDLDYGDSEIVRASFAFGDITGSGEEVLVLGGQYDKDIENNVTSRYVAIYSWNGISFVANTVKNFKLFAKDNEGNYENEAMGIGRSGETFFSMPLCPANLDIIKRGLTESAYLYLDSLLINYGDDGLEIVAALDQKWGDQGGEHANAEYFVEYGAVSGDLVGTGYETIATMKQKVSTVEQMTDKTIVWESYYKNWWHRWIGKKSYRPEVASTDNCSKYTPGETVMMTIDSNDAASAYYQKDQATSVCMPNTDFDTSYMVYEPGQGSHYFTYTDPEVLAVLASPPYAGDLLNRDDLSASYAESTTGYSSTKGSGGGETYNSTIEAGAYVSVEQEFKVFGVTVASAEAEQSITAGFTHEAETMQTMEQTISYSATAGEDMVAFYSIPLEVYEYTAFTANGDGTYTEQKMTVNMPHIAAVQMISLDKYEQIAKDYDVLPQIAGTVLTHELGDLSSYPSSSNGYLKAIEYEGTPARVGFSSNEGGSSIGQEISMTSEESNSYTVSTKFETKAGAGAGGVKVGVTFGSESGSGWVHTSTSGNSFSGEIQNMPIEAEEYGYGYCWRIFSYLYDDGKVQFPVVNYLVMDVTAPAPLPEDFDQNVKDTTDTQIALDWTYDKLIAGFQIYRYYEFPDGSGSYELAFVPMTDGTYNEEDGRYHFEYIDTNLSPYTDYQYQIQTVRSSLPTSSIPSQVVTLRTKTDRGYPQYSINGLDEDGSLRIFPDSISSVEAEVLNISDYSEGVSYKWQKLENGVWTDIPGMNEDTITFTASGSSDEALYRCRTNMVYFDESRGDNYYISAYTEPFETKYSKRTPEILEGSFTSTTYDNDNDPQGTGVLIALEFLSKDTNHYNAPSGNVTFTMDGTEYGAEYTKALVADSVTEDGKSVTRAEVNVDELPAGVYEVSAYYGGNRVFKSLSVEETSTFLVGDSGYQLLLKDEDGQSTEYVYGESIEPSLKSLSNSGGTTSISEVDSGVTYEINGNIVTLDENGKFATGNVGSYTLVAKHNGDAVAERNFIVTRRNISVLARHKDGDEAGVGKGFVEDGHQPVLELSEGSMAPEEELADLNLIVEARNTAGNYVALTNDTEPGNYTIYGRGSSSTDSTAYNNYEIKYIYGIYTIIGQTYLVSPEMDLYKDMTVGTITLSNSDDGKADEFSAATELLLYASPYDGYEVDSWRAIVTDTGAPIELDDSMFNETKTRLSYTMNAEDTTLTVTFGKAKTALTTAVEGEGSVVCDNNTAFVNGGNVNSGAEMSFTATPAAGYSFKEWRINEPGNPSVRTGNLNGDGTSTLQYQMPAVSTTLRAVFERDSYVLTFSDNMEAIYTYATGDTENPFAEKTVASGAQIVGDTEVLVKIKAGYSEAEGAAWTVNGVEIPVGDEGYRFDITGNTGILLDTVQNTYQIENIAENGSITVTVDGVETQDLSAVPGGSEVVFTAHPDHGYAFAGFTMTGTDEFTENGVVLAVAELGSDLSLQAAFAESTDFAIDLDYGARAGISYVLYDAFDVEVSRGQLASEDEADTISIDVCQGDRLEMTIVPDSGFMIDKWTIDNAVNDTRDKTYTFDDISANIDAKVELISQTSYTVNYGVGAGEGSIISATTDDVEFESGFADVGGNTDLLIIASPDDGQMMDHWEINGQIAQDSDGNKIISKTIEINNLRANSSTLTIEAFFIDMVEYAVTTTALDGADWSISIDPDEYDGKIIEGASYVLTLTPDQDHRVKAITGTALTSFSALETPKDGPWTATMDSASEDNAVTASVVPLYDIEFETVDNGSGSANAAKAEEGETVTIRANPASGYKLGTWNAVDGGGNDLELANASRSTTTFVMGTLPVTITPAFRKASSGSGGGGAVVAAPVEEADPLADALEEAEKNNQGKMVAKVKIEEKTDGEYVQEIPKTFFEKEDKILEVETPDGTVELHDAMFDQDPEEDVSVGISQVDPDDLDLSDDDKKLLEGKPVIDINISVGGEKIKWKSGKEKIKISIPYTLTEEEKADSHRVIAVFIDDDGNIIPLTSSSYNSETGSIVLETNHTSHYSVAFSGKTFEDMSAFEWAKEAVEALSARGVINGMSDTEFAPGNSIRRADFVLLVANFFELEGELVESFTDVAKDAYYAAAVAAAKDLGIINGKGNGEFSPTSEISRQDMMVILGRALSATDYTDQIDKSTGIEIDGFEDASEVSAYAKESISVLLEKGLVAGDGSNLNPKASTRRAEVAALLYKLLNAIK